VGAARTIGATARDRRLVGALLVLQAVISAGFAVFPTDPDGIPMTAIGAVHLTVFYAYAMVTPLQLALFGVVFGRDPRWQRARAPTLAAATAMVASGLLVPAALYGPLLPWLGLLERVYVAIPMAWQVVVAGRAVRLTRA
jgi:hypothetical protein